MKKVHKNTHSLRERFNYWFDNRMSKGSLGFIRFLIAASILLAMLIAGLTVILGFDETNNHAGVFWDSVATIINAWMPYYEDGSIGYIALMSVNAVAGILFTSVLIGIVTSAIEEKLADLKRGQSAVIEKDHIVVLGFRPGEYTLLNQLILAAEDAQQCIAVASDLEREEMEALLDDNLSIPKNVRIICRTIDIMDIVSIRKCAIATCKMVVIAPGEDAKVIKTILATSKLLQVDGASNVRINAVLSSNQYNFPKSLADTHNISIIKTSEILAKIIAHSCTQTGLAEIFREVFNFEGPEFHLIACPELANKTFRQAMAQLDNAVPSGIYRSGQTILNPSPDFLIQKDDRLIVFSETKASAVFLDNADVPYCIPSNIATNITTQSTGVVIVGSNEMLPIILQELPESVSYAYLSEQARTAECKVQYQEAADKRGLELYYYSNKLDCEDDFVKVARMAEHIVVLSDHSKSAEEADMEVMFSLLNFRDVRVRNNLNFNITVEMCTEYNQKLVTGSDCTDFLVASTMSSLFLAQLAKYPELIEVFRDILSNEGNELYLKNAGDLHICGTYTVAELRQITMSFGYILLGYIDTEKKSYLNLSLGQTVELTEQCDIIVLSEN